MSSKVDFRARLVKGFISLLKRIGIPAPFKKVNSVPHFLIVSTTGIGDTLWGTPALRLLKKNYPDSKVTFLTSLLGHQVLKNNPDIDHYHIIKHSFFSLISLFFKLRKTQFDAIFVFHISFRWIIPFCYFLTSNRLIGFDRHAKSFAGLLTDVYEVGLRHPILQRLALVKAYNKDLQGKETQIKLYLRDEEKQKAISFLKQKKVPKNRILIGFQPGASQAFKQWPLHHFITLAKKLKAFLPCEIVIFGNQAERHLGEAIQKEISVTISSGELSLRVSAALIGQMDLLITNDTGPMHLALAQKTQIVSIFSPTAPDLCWPHLNASWVRVIHQPIPCIKCVGHKCLKPYCLELISPEVIFAHAEQLVLPLIQKKAKLITT